MKTNILWALCATITLGLTASIQSARAQGTAFTYQGQLIGGTNAANGSYDLTFSLFAASSGGSPIAGPITNSATVVSNGLFTVALDFGASFPGADRWLEISVKTNGAAAFTTLAPRHKLTSTPYAIRAGDAGLLSGQPPTAFAPATGSANYVAKTGDTMTGSLALPANGLAAGGSQLVLAGGNVGVGTAVPSAQVDVQSGNRRVAINPPWLFQSVAAGGVITLSRPDDGAPACMIGGSAAPSDDMVVYCQGGGALMRLITQRGPGTGFGFYLVPGFAEAFGTNRPQPVMAIDGQSGNVGIGTPSPAANLEIRSTGSEANLHINADSASGLPVLRLQRQGVSKWGWLGEYPSPGKSTFFSYDGGAVLTLQDNGNVGIGTTIPQAKLDVEGDVWVGAGHQLLLLSQDNSAASRILNPTTGGRQLAFLTGDASLVERMRIDGAGNVGIGTTTPSMKLEVAGNLKVSGAGNSITTPVLSITGGADVAEPFTMSSADIPKGAVVVIDDAHPGQLKLSEIPYDKRVAGIVSGAGGVNPGMTLTQHGLAEGGQNVALTGRVYALADATDGPIHPGDMLTTSDVPGHAMKATDLAKAQGAILGKAMSSLPEGRGLVLVLVTLQ